MGEEYCDIYRIQPHRATGQNVRVSAVSKAIWMIIDMFLPYLQQRSALGWAQLRPGEQLRRLQMARHQAREQLQRQERSIRTTSVEVMIEDISDNTSLGLLGWMDHAVKGIKGAIEHLEARTGMSSHSWLMSAMAAHLALFYCNGKYVTFGKRAARIQYVMTHRLSHVYVHFAILVRADPIWNSL
jgi:hypothetical protein